MVAGWNHETYIESFSGGGSENHQITPWFIIQRRGQPMEYEAGQSRINEQRTSKRKKLDDNSGNQQSLFNNWNIDEPKTVKETQKPSAYGGGTIKKRKGTRLSTTIR